MNAINAAALCGSIAAMLMYPALSSPDTAQCGWIGVQVRPMTAAFARSLGMAVPYGAIFEQPLQGSAAANAGIREWDVVTTIDGVPRAGTAADGAFLMIPSPIACFLLPFKQLRWGQV